MTKRFFIKCKNSGCSCIDLKLRNIVKQNMSRANEKLMIFLFYIKTFTSLVQIFGNLNLNWKFTEVR